MAEQSALRLVVLISGTGSNLQAIRDREHEIGARVCAVISNRPDAQGLQRAVAAGIPTVVVDHRAYPERSAFEAELAEAIDAHAPDLIVLAGFMRVLTPAFVLRYQGRMLNIHPSLLPAWRGLHTHARVLAQGERWHGCSVHYVTPELDGGPVVLQARVPVLADDTVERLQQRVQRQEHVIYPRVIQWIAQGRLIWQQDMPWLDGTPLSSPVILEAQEEVS